MKTRYRFSWPRSYTHERGQEARARCDGEKTGRRVPFDPAYLGALLLTAAVCCLYGCSTLLRQERLGAGLLLAVAGLGALAAALRVHFRRRDTGRGHADAGPGPAARAMAAGQAGLWEWDLVTGRGRIDACAAATLGYTPHDADAGRDWLLCLHAEDRPAVQAARAGCETGAAASFEVDCRLRRADGAWTWMYFHSRPHPAGGGRGPICRLEGLCLSVHARKLAQLALENLAFRDSLTALPNRIMLQNRVAAGALSYPGKGERVVLYLDIDHFKYLSDTLGPKTGDRILRQVAARLQNAAHATDFVARWGGDKFVVLSHVSCSGKAAFRHARSLAGEIHGAIGQPYQIGNNALHITSSIGIAFMDANTSAIEESIYRARIALHAAKNAGRNNFRFFTDEMQFTLDEEAMLANDLRQALQRDELVLYFQPIVEASDRIVCAEALVRWRHRERGLISPVVFIPIAERSGLILPLGKWVMEQACGHMARWEQAYPGIAMQVAVNVSARQFSQDDFVGQVGAALERHRLDASRLKLELTESVLLHDVDDVIAKMMTLKRRGVSVALDDFGTGYSSLSYLQRLPLNQLKLDKSFVRDMLESAGGSAIVHAILALSVRLGIEVVAEGVETEAQRRALSAHGCRFFQGYLVSAPLPAADFSALLASAHVGRSRHHSTPCEEEEGAADFMAASSGIQ